jgi:hypothetical protein
MAELFERTGRPPRNCTRIRFRGYSMFPALRPGDTLILDVVAAADCSPGDIVCVAGDDGYTVHRVIAVDRSVNPPRIVTKGDSLPYPDPPTDLPPEGMPRVIMVSRGDRGLIRPRGGRFSAFLSRNNLTVGVIRARIAALVRGAARRAFTLFQ